MPQYVGFSSKNACKPRGTNAQLNGAMGLSTYVNAATNTYIDGNGNPINVNGYGIPNGYGAMGQPIIWGKKFKLTDAQLVIQDFVNALNIPLGSKVGQPGYGTTLWSFVFEPNTSDVQSQLENEIRRVASQDPRIDINIIKAFPQENGILIETQISILPFNNPLTVGVFFNQQTNLATLTAVS